jgi:asparagine synthase (glutamine-hydrolysing)
MCGISGVFSKEGRVCLSEVREMNDKIAHRGPDDASYYQKDHIALGHRRLSIIDLDERSNQPQEFDNLAIVFNGEIYNYQSVRAKLIDEGYEFITDGDCEVVLKAYHRWGKECVDQFKGMWAFAIYDTNKASLFCSRDRFGIKPFYYKLQEGRFCFGSEIKQLAKDGCKAVMENVLDFIIGGYVDHNNLTFFEGIVQLPPGSNLEIDLVKFEARVSQYFRLSDVAEEDRADDVKSLLDKSINEHLVSDVKLGSCLSGGLDSSYINYGLSRAQPNAIAIHSDSTDRQFSEKDKAECVAEYLGISLEVTEPKISEFKEDVDELFYAQEQPFGDPSVYMQFRVMKKAQSLGIKVMLDGQGADEVFMGYSKYLGVRLWSDFSLLKFHKFVRFFRECLQNNTLSSVDLVFLMVGTKFEKIRRIGLLKKSKVGLRYWYSFISRAEGAKSSREFQLSEIYQYPLQTLLRNEDRNSMWFSIEARVPYLDHELVQAVYQQPTKSKVSSGWSKSLLRTAAVGCLPQEIVYRTDKLGFNSPPSWLDDISYSEIFASKILHELFGRRLTWSWVGSLAPKMKWRLLSVAIWERVFKISI